MHIGITGITNILESLIYLFQFVLCDECELMILYKFNIVVDFVFFFWSHDIYRNGNGRWQLKGI